MEEWKARHTASLAELEGHGSAAVEATQLLGQLQQSSATAMAEIVSAGRPAARAEAPTAALPFGGALGGATGLAKLLGGGGTTSGSNAGAGTSAQSAQGGLSEATQAGENNTQAVPMDAGGRDGASGRGSRGSVGTGLPADSGAEKRERADSGDELAMHDGADTIVFQSPLAAAGRSGGDASAPDVSAASAAADALSKSQAKAARSKERRKQARGDWAAHQRRSTGTGLEDGPGSPSSGGARSGSRRRPSDTDERASPSAMRRGHHLQATASREYGDGVSLLPVCRVESSPELRGTYRARSSPQPPPPSPVPRGRTSSTPAGALRTPPLCSSPLELCLT